MKNIPDLPTKPRLGRCLGFTQVGTITLAQAVTFMAFGRFSSSAALQRLRRWQNGRLSKDRERKLEDAAMTVMTMLMQGQVSALGNHQVEGSAPNVDREPIPLTFLKDSAWADPFTDTILTDWLCPQHFAGPIRGFKHVRLDREEFFRTCKIPDGSPASPSLQQHEVDRAAKKTRTRPKEDEALLKNRIEGVLATAQRQDPKRRTPLHALAAELAKDSTKNQGYRKETIRQILRGTYLPMKRLGICGLHQQPAAKRK